jgi:RNA polymerase sigma factor (sigma-70 family)
MLNRDTYVENCAIVDRRRQISGGSGPGTVGWTLDQQQYDRLVGFCRRMTRDANVAEDLAGETLLEAWRNAHKVTDVDGLDRWLRAVARHVYQRWRRRRGRDAHLVPLADWHHLTGAWDIEHAALQHEFDAELSNALASLPSMSRTAFLLRHLEDESHSEIATRIGASEDAVSMRLSRARRQLRAMLDSPRSPEESHLTPDTVWQETRLWCSRCGHRYLQMRYDRPGEIVAFRCPGCDDDPRWTATEMPLTNAHFARLIGDVRQPAAIIRRIERWVNEYFRRALADSVIECTNCGLEATVIYSMPEMPSFDSEDRPGVYVRCDRCGTACSSSLHSLVMTLPEVSDFRRRNGRFRTLPARELEVAGQPAIATTLVSVAGSARIDVLSARNNFAVLGVRTSN